MSRRPGGGPVTVFLWWAVGPTGRRGKVLGCSVLSQGLAHRNLLARAASASSSPKRPNGRCLVLSSAGWHNLAVIHTPFWEANRALQKLVEFKSPRMPVYSKWHHQSDSPLAAQPA